MGRHHPYRRSYRRSGRLPWTQADTDRLNAKLVALVQIDAGILANNPPLDWLIDMRKRYRSVTEDHAEWESDHAKQEWYREVLAGSDERWRKIQEMADEMIAEHLKQRCIPLFLQRTERKDA
jgi:hypothetical protein